MEQFTKYCLWCDEPFQTEFETKDYCSRYHKERARQSRRQKSKWSETGKFCKIFPKECTVCNDYYIGRTYQNKYCSNDCRKFHSKEIKRQREREFNRQAKGIRSKLYFRDRGLCQICNQSILIDLAYPHPQSLSIDHIVPISKGGTSAMNNLQITHLRCNLDKSDTLNYKYIHDLEAENKQQEAV